MSRIKPETTPDPRFNATDVARHWRYHLDYLVEILNGTYPLEEARKDYLSLVEADK